MTLTKEDIIEIEIARINTFQKIITDNKQYNSVVCSLGYVSLLAMITYTHNFISDFVLKVIFILFVLSLFIFVVFEIWKVNLNNKFAEKHLYSLVNSKLYKMDTKRIFRKNQFIYYRTYKLIDKLQPILFIVSAILGFSAGVLMLVSLFFSLLK